MNRDDIIRMAREANGEEAWDGGVEWVWEEVERFANLVAAAEHTKITSLLRRAMHDYLDSEKL